MISAAPTLTVTVAARQGAGVQATPADTPTEIPATAVAASTPGASPATLDASGEAAGGTGVQPTATSTGSVIEGEVAAMEGATSSSTMQEGDLPSTGLDLKGGILLYLMPVGGAVLLLGGSILGKRLRR